jgi:iron only hydrogenase large subunit-like protein/uncharacterized Fe-S cluster-containing protein
MSTIQFKEANCKNCYKCIRSCPVKAIEFKNDQAQIIEAACILCGKCLQVCPQNAKSVKNDVDKVKTFISNKQKVYASVAPAFAPAFNMYNEKNKFGVLRKLGFTHVEETAIGASRVSKEYEDLMLSGELTNIITTACPTVVSLVEKYYPELISQLAPVVSPMIAHAKMMKEIYGSRIKIVFIGPCISKKEEYKDNQNDDLIDAVITFEELEKWAEEEGISFHDDYAIDIAGMYNNKARFYPAPGGIIKSLNPNKKYDYKLIKFDGLERCIEILDEVKNGNVKKYFIEMNSCVGSCLGGPCMNSNCASFLELKDRLDNYVSVSASIPKPGVEFDTRINVNKFFRNKSWAYKIPEETTIREILNKIGKFSKEKELNCGACGYSNCREKAIAVYNKKADVNMCLPYMRESAESISNLIINSTPNAIFALNEDLTIKEINLSARKMFRFEGYETIIGKKIDEIIKCPDFQQVRETKEGVFNKKYHYIENDIIAEQSILYVSEQQMIFVFMKDITEDEKKQQQMYAVRCETVEIAQKVIDKQMRVAQQIASLLGETTAETKVALTKLKKSIQSEIGDNK